MSILGTLCDLSWKLGVAAVAGQLIVTQLVGPVNSPDPIMKMIELDQVTSDWCRQRTATEVEIEKCVFNSQ